MSSVSQVCTDSVMCVECVSSVVPSVSNVCRVGVKCVSSVLSVFQVCVDYIE